MTSPPAAPMSTLSPVASTVYFGGRRSASPLPPSASGGDASPRIRSHSSVAFYDRDAPPLPRAGAARTVRYPSVCGGEAPVPARHASVTYGAHGSSRLSPRSSASSPFARSPPQLSLAADDDCSFGHEGHSDNIRNSRDSIELMSPPYEHIDPATVAYTSPPPPNRHMSLMSRGQHGAAIPPPRCAVRRVSALGGDGAARSGSLRLPPAPQHAPPLTLARHARSETSPTQSGATTPQYSCRPPFDDQQQQQQQIQHEPQQQQRTRRTSQRKASAIRPQVDPSSVGAAVFEVLELRQFQGNNEPASAPLPRRKLPEVPTNADLDQEDFRLREFEDFLRFSRVSSDAAGTRSATRASMRLALTPKASRDESRGASAGNFLGVASHADVHRKTSENNLAISHYRKGDNNNNSNNNICDRLDGKNARRNNKKSIASFDFPLENFNNNSDNKLIKDNNEGPQRSSSYVNCDEMGPPPRSQSFRHRARPVTLGAAAAAVAADARRPPLEELGERRRSTPTIHRRSSLQQKNRALDRTDVWPEPKQISEIEERFLRLPDSEDYTRVRQFKIDSKGAVVSRGDSFRRKRHANVSQSNSCNFDGSAPSSKNESSLSPFPTSDSDSARTANRATASAGGARTSAATVGTGTTTTASESRSTSVSSNDSAVIANKVAKSSLTAASLKRDGLWDGVVSLPTTDDGSLLIEDAPSTSHPSYKVYVLGQSGSGKSSLVSQFVSSEYRNAFADEIEEVCNATTVSVNIGGFECDLNFYESDPNMDPYWIEEPVAAYLLVYSIDRKSSFRTVVNALETIRSKRKSVPIILAGNKVDLERKRAVSAHEVKCVALTYDVVHFEISVALNHDVDDLLVGIVAEIKESVGALQDAASIGTGVKNSVKYNDENSIILAPSGDFAPSQEPEEFRAAIRRFSQRKKRQMGAGKDELDGGKCANLNPVGLFEKFRQWRRGISKC